MEVGKNGRNIDNRRIRCLIVWVLACAIVLGSLLVAFVFSPQRSQQLYVTNESTAISTKFNLNTFTNSLLNRQQHIERNLLTSVSNDRNHRNDITVHKQAADDHGDDDHGDDDGDDDGHGGDDDGHGTSFQLFRAIVSLNVMIGTLGVIIVIFAVQAVEYFFHSLHMLTHDSPFEQMVFAIEKELMVVGFTAFLFKVIVATTTFLSPDWFHALEFADVLVPIFSFSYCGIGLCLIVLSIKQSKIWSQAYHHKLLELLDGYFDIPGFTGWLPYRLLWAPFDKTVAVMEFRIFHNIFCDTYKIQKQAFAFNEYVEKVFERFVLTAIEIRPWDWFLVCVFLLLNWARYELSWHDGKGCYEDDYQCKQDAMTRGFIFAGVIIFLITCIFAIESRRLEIRIMGLKGIYSIHTYPSYLEHMELTHDKAIDSSRLDESQLRQAAEEVKFEHVNKDIGGYFQLIVQSRQKKAEDMITRLNVATVQSISKKERSKRQKRSSWVSRQSVSATSSSSIAAIAANVANAVTPKKLRGSITGVHENSQQELAAALKRSYSSHSPKRAPSRKDRDEVSSFRNRSRREISNSNSGRQPTTADSESSYRGGNAIAGSFIPDASSRAIARALSPRRVTSSATVDAQGDTGDASNAASKQSVNAEAVEKVADKNRTVTPESKESEDGSAKATTATAAAAEAEPVSSTRSDLEFGSLSAEELDDQLGPSTGIAIRRDSSSPRNSNSNCSSPRTGASKHLPRTSIQLAPIVTGTQSSHMIRHSNSGDLVTDFNGNGILINGNQVKHKSTAAEVVNERSPRQSRFGQVVPLANPSSDSSLNVEGEDHFEHHLVNDHGFSTQATDEENTMIDQANKRKASVRTNEVIQPVIPPGSSKSPSNKQKYMASPKLKIVTSPSQLSYNSSKQLSMQFSKQVSEASGSAHYSNPDDLECGARLESDVAATTVQPWLEESNLQQVFFLSWPALYLEGVQALIMLIALYLALYLTNFIAAARTPQWQIIALLPGVLSMILYVYIVKCAVILDAVHVVDVDAVLEVIDQTEGARLLGDTIRSRMLERLEDMGEPQAELFNLFQQIDANGNGNLSKDEFAVFMHALELNFSRKKMLQVFRGIDTNFDEKISFEEFFVFLFPDHNVALALEKKKQRILTQRIFIKSKDRAADIARYSWFGRQQQLHQYRPSDGEWQPGNIEKFDT